MSLPVSLVNVPEGKEVEVPSDLVVSVEISAHEDVSRRIEDMTAVIDLSNYQYGERNYPIVLQNLPNDIQARISPEYKKVHIYDIVTKDIPVNLRVSSNSLLTNVSYSPKTVSVIGSTKVLDSLKSLNTYEFNYKVPIMDILKTNVDIVMPNKVRLQNNQSVEVTLYFNQRVHTNEVFLPVEYENIDSNFMAIGSRAVSLSVMTVVTNIENLLLESRVSLDFTNITEEGEYDIPLQISTPTNMIVLNAPVTLPIILMAENKNEINLDEFTEIVEASLEGLSKEEVIIEKIDTTETTNTNDEEL